MTTKPYFSFRQYLNYVKEAEDPLGYPVADPVHDVPKDTTGNLEIDKHPEEEISNELPSEPPETPAPEVKEEDPNRQGVIRTVPKAHLVYKRKTPDGTFEELWVYNTGGSMQDELSIRRNILAGTDIPTKKTKSPDGKQHYTVWTIGNAQLVNIQGLLQ